MMRKIFVALLVGAVAVGLAAPAFAADLKYTGAARFRFQFDKNLGCFTAEAAGVAECDGHVFQMRFRPRFEVETEGGAKAVLHLEIGDLNFGTTAKGTAPASSRGSVGGIDADAVNVETKHAYMEFPFPGTPLRLRAGVQPWSTPKGLVIGPVDGVGLTLWGKLGEVDTKAWWMRANNIVAIGAEGTEARDWYVVDLSLTPWKDLEVHGYVVYDHDMETPVGPAPGENGTGVWFGLGAAGKVQNFRWDADFAYGSKDITDPVGAKGKKSGVVLDFGLGTAIAGTPLDLEARAWYASGNKGDGGDNEGYPSLTAELVTGAQIWTGDPAIDVNDTYANSPENTWGIGLIARYTVSPTLRLTGNVHYIGTVETGTAGTPAAVGDGTLSGVDSVGTDIGVKVDYTIARGLVFTLTASYLFLGDDTSISAVATRFDDVTKVAGVVNYGF